MMEFLDEDVSFTPVSDAELIHRLGSLRGGATLDTIPCHHLSDVLARAAAIARAGMEMAIFSQEQGGTLRFLSQAR